VLKPAIILPATAEQWDEVTLRCALRHELEHVVRWDFLTHCLSRMVCAGYWFHPLVWTAWRRLRLEAERACDDAVLREDDARDYASLLVSIARRDPAGKGQPLLAMAGRDDLAARVAAVLDDSQARGRVGRRWAAWLIVTGAVAILGVAPVTVARAIPQTQATSPAVPVQTSAAASIKRYPLSVIRHVDGRMIATNVSLRQLLIFAFGVRDIDRAPWWVEDRFDVIANAPADFIPQQGSKMLQSVLAERFKLVAHRGSKEFPIYALVLARPDGRLGPQMTPSQINCSLDAARACGMSSAFGRFAGSGVSMAQLAKHLPQHMGSGVSRQVFDRQVIDRTGLSGRFDFTLQWIPDAAVPSPAVLSGPPPYRPFASSLESNAPRFLAALREQLGLSVDSQLTPEPVLVIDKIERVTEN
jgi:bla regulator protein blaR1